VRGVVPAHEQGGLRVRRDAGVRRGPAPRHGLLRAMQSDGGGSERLACDHAYAAGMRTVLRVLARSALVVAAVSGTAARAQDDLRDVVTKSTGAALRGRVFARYEPGVVTVLAGGRRQDVPLADIVALDTVRDRVREFFALLDRLPDNDKHRWFMAQWAADHELPDLARLMALDVVLRDPAHADAHRLLGHRERRGEWQWPSDGEWKSFAALEAERADWQHAWQIDGEHFRVKCDAELRRVVDAVFDLERFHVAWFERFGEGMRLYEVVDKLHVEIWRDERRFPGMRTVPGRTTGKNPYHEHYGGKGATPSVSRTYFADANAERPARLFEMATFHLLYCTVADNANLPRYYRPAAWGELGLARYLEHSTSGPAGRAVVGAWQIDRAEAELVLAHGERDLGHVTQRDSKKLWGGVSDDNAFAWPAVELAVAFLLESRQPTGLRDGFFRYMAESRRPPKGDSTTVLDRNLGRPIEQLDAPWRGWIRERLAPPPVTAPATRTK
jgi:hypothetical protein